MSTPDSRGKFRTVGGIIAAFMGRQNTIAIPTVMVRLMGDYAAAAFVSQCVYWHERSSDPDGWFYKTAAEWEEELHLSRKQVLRCTRAAEGIVQVELRGMPATNHYRVDMDALLEALSETCGFNNILPKGATSSDQREQQVSNQRAQLHIKEAETTSETTYREKDGAGKLRGASGESSQPPSRAEQAPASSEDSDRAHGQATQPHSLTKSGVEVPPALAAAPGFVEAWAEWLAYRRERRLTTSPRTLQSQLRNLEKWGHPVEVIEQSISNGWAGLFALKTQAGRKPQTMQEANERLMGRAAETMSVLKGVFDE